MKDQSVTFFSKYISTLSLQGVSVRWEDIVEILIISFLVYQIMTWIKNTKAWFYSDLYFACYHIRNEYDIVDR